MRIALLAGGVLLGLGLWWFWPQSGGSGRPAQTPTAVEAIPVTRGDVVETLVLPAQIEALKGVTLQAEMAGKVRRLPNTEGRDVKQGEVLIELDPRMAQAEVARTSAEAELAAATLARLEAAEREGAVSPLEMDEARARYTLAKAARLAAQAALDKHIIKAPFAGRAGLQQVVLGQSVSAGQPLINVVDERQLRVRFSLPEKALSSALEGMTVTVRSAGGVLTTSLTTLDSLIDPATRNRGAQVVLAAEDAQTIGLQAGQFAEISLPLTLAQDAVVVLAQALLPGLEGPRVMVVSGTTPRIGMEAVAIAQPITILARSSETVAIQGVDEGAWVVIAGQQKLRGPAPAIRLVTPTVLPFIPAQPES